MIMKVTHSGELFQYLVVLFVVSDIGQMFSKSGTCTTSYTSKRTSWCSE